MSNPRKFSEKIALHTQKQAEGTAAFEAIIREVSATTKSPPVDADAAAGRLDAHSSRQDLLQKQEVPASPRIELPPGRSNQDILVRSDIALRQDVSTRQQTSPVKRDKEHTSSPKQEVSLRQEGPGGIDVPLRQELRQDQSLRRQIQQFQQLPKVVPLGRSLPNVNQLARNSIDLKHALSNLADVRQAVKRGGRPLSTERLNRDSRSQSQPRKLLPLITHRDISPYRSQFLSAPNDASWRRASSESAIHSRVVTGDGALQSQFGGSGTLLSSSLGLAGERGRLPVGGYPDNAFDQHGVQDQLKARSCEVPGINISLPAADQHSASLLDTGGGHPVPVSGGLHIMGGGLLGSGFVGGGLHGGAVGISDATGSLPDLAIIKFSAPLYQSPPHGGGGCPATAKTGGGGGEDREEGQGRVRVAVRGGGGGGGPVLPTRVQRQSVPAPLVLSSVSYWVPPAPGSTLSPDVAMRTQHRAVGGVGAHSGGGSGGAHLSPISPNSQHSPFSQSSPTMLHASPLHSPSKTAAGVGGGLPPQQQQRLLQQFQQQLLLQYQQQQQQQLSPGHCPASPAVSSPNQILPQQSTKPSASDQMLRQQQQQQQQQNKQQIQQQQLITIQALLQQHHQQLQQQQQGALQPQRKKHTPGVSRSNQANANEYSTSQQQNQSTGQYQYQQQSLQQLHQQNLMQQQQQDAHVSSTSLNASAQAFATDRSFEHPSTDHIPQTSPSLASHGVAPYSPSLGGGGAPLPSTLPGGVAPTGGLGDPSSDCMDTESERLLMELVVAGFFTPEQLQECGLTISPLHCAQGRPPDSSKGEFFAQNQSQRASNPSLAFQFNVAGPVAGDGTAELWSTNQIAAFNVSDARIGRWVGMPMDASGVEGYAMEEGSGVIPDLLLSAGGGGALGLAPAPAGGADPLNTLSAYLGDSFEDFSNEDVLRLGLDPLGGEELEMLEDPSVVTDPATEDLFRQDQGFWRPS